MRFQLGCALALAVPFVTTGSERATPSMASSTSTPPCATRAIGSRHSDAAADNLHPNDAGYEAMARAIDLGLFERPALHAAKSN